ncbi:MAG TPA: nickel-binding protein [Myxococcales bacterium]|nr:nickel-binding protein [Myxococcales bacterium]
MQRYVVEHEFNQPLTPKGFEDSSKKAGPCYQQYGVVWLASYLASDGLKMICEFEAESAEHIRDALRSAEVPFARVWPAHKYQR